LCELFGFNSDLEVTVRFYPLERKAEKHNSWGVSFFKEGAAVIYKEEKPVYESQLARYIGALGFKTKIAIFHIRHATYGSISYWNCHPFERELFGRSWVFAHTGTVNILYKKEFEPKYYKPIGETDSELAFCYILSEIRRREARSLEEIAKVVKEVSDEIGSYGSFNFLMSDSKHLFCYRSEYGGPMYYLERSAAVSPELEWSDTDYERIDIVGRNVRVAIVSSRRVTNEYWKVIPEKRLLILGNGREILKL